MNRVVRSLAVALLTFCAVAAPLSAAAFTPGNVVVYRVGTGAAALTGAATAAFLDEYTPAGVLVQSIPLPTADAGAQQTLTNAGSATTEGLMTRSADGRYLVFGGYDAAPGTGAPNAAAAATINRVFGRADSAGNIDTSTATTTFSSGNIRGVTSLDGTQFWGSGSVTGVVHVPFGTSTVTVVSSTVTNLRSVNIAGPQLYVSSASGTLRLGTVGTGTPTTAGQTITNLPGFATATTSPYQYAFVDLDNTVAGIDTVYVSDDRSTATGGGVQKWTFDGSTWTQRGTLATGLANGLRGLTAAASGGNVTIFATDASGTGRLVTATDTGGPAANITSTGFTTLVTGATNTAMRGVAFAPVTPPPAGPTVTSIVRANASPTNAASVDWTVTFSESVTGVDTTDFTIAPVGVTGAAVSNVTGSGTTWTVTATTGTGDGQIRLDLIDNDSIVNGSAVPLGGPGPQNYTSGEIYGIDKTAPAVQSIVRASANPTNAGSVDFTVTFTEPVIGGGTYGIATTGSLAGTSVTNITGTGATRTVTVNTGTGSGDLRLDFIDDDTVADGVGNTTAANFTAGEVYNIDRIAPAVQSIVRAEADPTAASTVDFTVTFTEPVGGVDAADFTLTTTGGIAGASVMGVSGTGTTRTVTVNTGTGSGTIRLDFTSNGSVLDPAGNPTTAGFTTGEAYTIDRSAPAVSSINRASANPTNATSVDFTVTFTQSVTGVDATDFVIDAAGTFAGAAVTNVTGSGTTYTVTASWTSGEGTMSIDLIDNDSITSTATTEPLGGAGANNADFTAGQAYTVDTTPPSVQSVTRANANPTSAASVDFTVTFSEPVGGVDPGDFTLTTTGPITGVSITGLTGTGATRTVTVNTGSNNGTIRLDVIDNDTINDPAANNLTGGFTGGEVYNVDKLPPVVQSITRTNPNPNGAASVDFTVTFNEPVTGVDAADFTLATTGVSGASITGVSGTADTYTVSVSTGTGDGTIRLDLIDNGSIVDPANNPLGGPGPTNGDFTTGETYTIARPPATPTGLNATPGNNTVALTWNASAGATGYNVKRSTVSGGPYTTISTNQPGTTFNDNTAVNGTTYYYVVSALNANGESPDSAQVTATPGPQPNQIGVVISQLFGGNGGAYQSDYIELFNPTASAVPLTGYALQYGSATGNFGSVSTNIYTFGAGVSIGAGRYLTVKFGTAAGGTPVTADIDVPTGGLNMSGASGKVALTINGTALGCGATATPCALPHASIVDLVAYGAANNGEGGTSVKNGTALTTSEGALRKLGGCQDTQNNNNDFDVATTGTGLVPRTAATPPNVCGPVNLPPNITPPSDPYTTVAENAAPFPVSLTGVDDGGIYTWAATPGTGVQSVVVTAGQGTANVTYTVTLQTNFYGTATFTASLSDGVHPSDTQAVNIAVTRDLGIDHVPTITPPANPYTIVGQNPPPQTVNLTGNDDNNIYNWGATPGTGVQSVVVTAGQGTANVTYNVTIQAGFIGTATFTATLSDGVNPPTQQAVNIGVSPTGSTVNHLVISQIYAAGGNASATWSHDYVEIYNPTGNPVNLTGWTLQYASATTTGNFTGIAPLGGTIGPGQYFLVQLASNDTTVGAPLVSPTLTGDINMSGSNGKIALVNNSDPLTGSCGTLLTDPNIVDFVGYGTANCSEGNNNAPTFGNNQSALFRASNGDVDTDNNGNDFTTGPASPHPHVPPVEVGPFVVSTEPSSNDTIAPRDLNVVVIFNESVDVTGAWYDITCVTSGNHNSATFSRSGSRSWTIVPNQTFIPGEQCTATLFASQIVDTDTDDAAPGTNVLPSNYSWNFTIATGTAPAYPPSVHLTFGNPTDAVADLNTPDNFLMEKPELTLSYNRSRNTPNWVSWHLADEWVGTLPRNDTFRADPAIDPTWYRVLGSDYSGSGFDRGHMVPNADRDKETSVPINQATFLMTNMLPQAPDNNQGPWANMENYLRTLLPANELYIVAGGLGTGGTGSNGFTTTITTLNGGTITVPSHTWKVVLVLPKAGGDDVSRVAANTCTVAVLMPNIQGIRTQDPNDWLQYLTTVDNIEAQTGYDFFENVPDAIEAAIEGGTNCTNPPGAANKTATVAEDGSTGITLEGSSPSNAPLTYVIVTNPANGQLTGTGANRTYTPNPDYFGPDSFTYKVNDGQDSNVATVTITVTEVNDPPVAAADAKNASSNTPLTFPASDLTANDSKGPANEVAQTLTVTAVTQTAGTNGTVSLNGGNVTYTSNPGFTGPASFEYTVCDNGTTAGAAAVLCATGIVNVTVSAQPPVLTSFVLTIPANVTEGVPFNATVTARDQFNNVFTGYTGTVHFTSTSAGSLPSDYTFTGGDAGVHTFSVTMTNAGVQTLTVTDTATSINTSAQTNVGTNPQPPVLTSFVLNIPANVTEGVPFNATVTARDQFNNVFTGYTGTVHFTSTSAGTLPSDYTFTGGDAGVHTFSVIMTNAGNQTLTVTDTATSINTSAQTNVTANPQAPVLSAIAITSAPATATQGVPFNVTVTAFDQFGAVYTGYTGTVHFTSSSTGTLPADYTFTGADAGSHTFSVTLNSLGNQTLTVTDVATSLSHTVTINVMCPGTVGGAPAVTMPPRVCANSPNNTASAPSGAATYNWTITNGTITAGQGTSQITFTAGASGTVTVQVAATTAGGCGNYNTGGSAPIVAGPTVSLPPNVAACSGSQVTIPVTLTGTAPFTIVWSDGFTQSNVNTTRTSRTINVSSARSLRITSVSDASCNTATSQTVNIIVNTRPVIDQQPQDVDVNRGQTARLVVVASGMNIRYQWYEGLVGDESKPVGDNFGDFTTPPLDKKTEYWVKISNTCGSVSSRQVTVRVLGNNGGRRRAVAH